MTLCQFVELLTTSLWKTLVFQCNDPIYAYFGKDHHTVQLTFITTHYYKFSFLFVMRILKIYSPRDFQIYNRVLLTIFTKLHITSDNWTYNFWPPSPISSLPLHHPPPPPLATTNVFPVSLSYVCVCVCLFFFNSTWN